MSNEQQPASVSSVEKFSISINKGTKDACDLVLTPEGFISPPRGTYSQLINSLLNGYLETVFQTDFLTIFDLMNENPGISCRDLRNLIADSKGE